METHQFCSDDILIEILTFLPAKSLMRFKCISKACNTSTQHRNFIQSHYARSQTRPSATRLLFQLRTYPPSGSCLSYHPETSKSEVFPLELDCFSENSICSNSCNGLVCWYSYKHNLLYLYNVTTKEIKPFSSSINKDILSRQIFTKQPRLFLGFDGNYKLLHIFSNLLFRLKGKILTLEETNSSWRKIDVIDEINGSRAFNYFVECIFFNEVVYWYSWNDSMVYFNFREEKFGYILLPNFETSMSFAMPSIIRTVLGGKLVIKGPVLFPVYHVNQVCEKVGSISVAAMLLGAEWINEQKMEHAHVLATTNVMSAPASLLLSSSRRCYLKIVRSSADHNDDVSPRIVFNNVSIFVENIIPLTSLLV